MNSEIELPEFHRLLTQHRDGLKTRERGARELRDISGFDLYGADPIDRATQEDDTTRIARQTEAQLRQLRAVDAALLRVQEGSYGECVACYESICASRLRAIPYAALCARCAEKQEQRAKSRRLLQQD